MRPRFLAPLLIIALVGAALPAHAASEEAYLPAIPAVGFDVAASTDSENFDVLKLSGRFLWRSGGRDKYQGVSVERAWFRSDNRSATSDDRVYLELADEIGTDWRFRAKVGSDGRTVLGTASIRATDWSKELFVERDMVESAQGVRQRIYYSMAGVSFDLPAGPKDTLNLVAAMQEFTGKNERLHLRGTYIRVLKPELGLSAQLRARYFRSTHPAELDYFSPRNFAQILPVAQVRRFDSRGWMYLAAIGFGSQKSTGAKWQGARLLDLRVESPAAERAFQAFAQFQYSNSSISGGASDYHYAIGRAGLTKRF